MRTVIEEMTRLSEVAAEAQLHLSHPDIYASLERLQGIVADAYSPIEAGAPVEPSPDSSGQVQLISAQVQAPRQYPPTPPLPTRQHTYAFQEVRFARRLQRYCLEHAFRLYVDFRSDPREIHRVFRLVPCVRDRGKTQPRFRQLLMGGRADPLEVPSLPFYTVGGAGTHFPDVDEEGNAIYPANSRMPRRVLGVLPWPELGTKGGEEALEAYGLGGEWFDSRDVEGYLKLHGVDVNGGLFPTLHVAGGAAETDRSRSFVLDVEGFFSPGARWSGRSRAPPPTATILLLFLPPAWRSGWQGRRQQHPSQRRCRRGRRSKPAPVLHSGRFRETPLSHPGTPFAVLSAPATCSLLNTTHLCVVQSAAIAEHLYPIATVNLTLIN
ncbi:uncharacterized protein AFUA_6G11870 [Aspergillus fumigatus Af293]|uniref:Uncharacterized protein n=1 Tax=Aspergillus fumigatus (strain ATCC MYA-4609 / CBS 101355 / FGSC A1100 / Af293) TaxID=330879 RepID=Q4WLY5_ASPFU|nr:hypothetical protein AFUA_6G11870 [Aspergillus fumigatus Af293]EAL89029.2 hypothetical protein AFUA_6G11870 [Aspergillus fumigatus Af293]